MLARLVFVLLLLWISPLWASTVTLQWDAPTTNADGTLLTDLAGYRLYMANQVIPDDKGTAELAVEVAAPTATPVLGEVATAVLLLTPANGWPPHTTVFFRVLAFDIIGNESELSNEVSMDVLPPGKVIIVIESVTP
ncbi:MAG: hypothetical protein V3W09_04375 [Nitrososphaerales archaeon]